jgi:hypothetical protein
MSTDLKAMLADIKRAIADDEFSPSKWESEFLETVSELINFDLPLSEKQDEKFEAIWEKATGQAGGDEDDPDEDDFA